MAEPQQFDPNASYSPVNAGGFDPNASYSPAEKTEKQPERSGFSNFLGAAWQSLPTNMIVQAGQHLSDWAKKKAETNRQENLAAAAKGQPQPHSEITNTGLDTLGTYGKYESGAAKPQSLAIAGAGMVAPEVVGPALVLHGGYTAVKNAPEALKGNPEAVESTLGGAAEAVGGGTMTREALAGGAGQTNTGQAIKRAATATGIQTPEAVPSMMRAIKPTNSKTDFPRTLASAGPDLQAHAQATGSPITNIAELVDAIPQAKKGLWQQYQAKLGPNAQATIDGNAVADAMVKNIDQRTRVQNPQLVKQIESTADTYRKPLTLADAEDFLQSANNELHSYYAKNKVGQQVAAKDPTTGHVVAEANALRSALYDKLDELAGPGTADLKRRYGALSDLQEEALRRKNVADRQSQVGTMASLGKIGGIAKIAKGVMTLDPADVASGLAEGALGQRISNLNNTDWLINNAFNGPKSFGANSPRTITVNPSAPPSVPSSPQRITGISQIGARPGINPTEIVGNAGAKFVGVQKGYGIRPDQVLFQPKTGGTTLAIDIDKLSPETIRAKIKASGGKN